MSGLFITFEGTEGGGKSTQIQLLAETLRGLGHTVRTLREPGGTPIGEEIRHLLKHSEANRGMSSETELLLMNASRAQIVREVIQPALQAGEIVLCDRFYDSTIAYQGYGRRLDLGQVQGVVDFAVGTTHPDLTLLLAVPLAVSEARRQARNQAATAWKKPTAPSSSAWKKASKPSPGRNPTASRPSTPPNPSKPSPLPSGPKSRPSYPKAEAR